MTAKLTFKTSIARKKPSNKDRCPFCYTENLGVILDQEDDIIWVENKYPVFDEAYQTVIIESAIHESDISTYSCNKNRKLFSYVFDKWHTLQESGRYQSVLCYKNFGPLSGGSLRHPHMQIVGLTHLDAYAKEDLIDFSGLEVRVPNDDCQVTVSLNPMAGGTEINASILNLSHIDRLADRVQDVIQYLECDYFKQIGQDISYNLFFYPFGEGVVCKIMPRHVVSPYFMGYGIRQVPSESRLAKIAESLSEFIAKKVD